MRKRDELSNPESYLNRAADDEMIFVLLGRDSATPATIRAWVWKRIRLGKNKAADLQIIEALDAARALEGEGNDGTPEETSEQAVARLEMTLRAIASCTLTGVDFGDWVQAVCEDALEGLYPECWNCGTSVHDGPCVEEES